MPGADPAGGALHAGGGGAAGALLPAAAGEKPGDEPHRHHGPGGCDDPALSGQRGPSAHPGPGGKKAHRRGNRGGVSRPGPADSGPHHPSDPAGQPGETGGVAHRALPGTGPAGCGAAEGPGGGTVPAKDPSGAVRCGGLPGSGRHAHAGGAVPALCQARRPLSGHEEQQDR